jgi:hypothetical protein
VSRFTVYSITGYSIEGIFPRHLVPMGRGPHDAVTTWYVSDDLECGEVLGEFLHEHEARSFRLKLAALDREHDKHQEREALAASNGHAR